MFLHKRTDHPFAQLARAEKWVYEEIERAIEGYFARCNEVPGPYYAYWRRGSILITDREMRPDYELITGERIGLGWTRDYLRAWLKQLVWSLPILPEEHT